MRRIGAHPIVYILELLHNENLSCVGIGRVAVVTQFIGVRQVHTLQQGLEESPRRDYQKN